jgi:predicted metalloprotease with PDZ domain
MENFARAFFGINDGSYVTVTYTFDDIVHALNAVLQYDWATFLNTRLNDPVPAPLNGIAQGGYRLVYTDKPSDFTKSAEHLRKYTDLLYSLGVTIDHTGSVMEVLWDGPAFNAGITVGTQIVAVNGRSYDMDDLKDTITAAVKTPSPIQLLLKRGDRYDTVSVNYRGGLRYPHLERVPNTPGLLDDLLAPRK